MIHSMIYSNIGIILWDLDSVEKANVKLKYLTTSSVEIRSHKLSLLILET